MRGRRVAEFLERHEIPRDGVLFVHSAFRALGAGGWSPEDLIDGFLDYLASGTLLLPAMSWRAVNPQSPRFDERTTPSITGILSEVFRTRYATARSLHPTHSVCGRGPDALAMLGQHHHDDTPCGDRSPVGRLAQTGGKILLLGVEMDSCTLVHHGEEKIAPEIYLRPETESYVCRRADGGEVTVRIRRHVKLARNFWQFEDALAARGLVRLAPLDGVACRSFSAADMNDEVTAALRADPRATIAKPGQRFKMM